MGTKIKVQKYFLKQQLTQAMANLSKYETAYKMLVERYNQLLGQARELNQTNNMQALLIASMIKESPDQVLEVKHETMNSFEKSRIMIDAKGDEVRGVQILKFESTPIPQEELDRMEAMRKQIDEAQKAAKEAQSAIDAATIADCTDPNCKLPKDLKHKHEPMVATPEHIADVVVTNEEANAEVAVAAEAVVTEAVAVEDGPDQG